MEYTCTLKEKMKVRLIEASVKDDGDYDYIYDNAVQNTLKSYWSWAESSKGKVSFVKNYEDIGYTFTLCVDAEFEEQEDYALFKLAHGDKPFTKLVIDNMMNGEFTHG